MKTRWFFEIWADDGLTDISVIPWDAEPVLDEDTDLLRPGRCLASTLHPVTFTEALEWRDHVLEPFVEARRKAVLARMDDLPEPPSMIAVDPEDPT